MALDAKLRRLLWIPREGFFRVAADLREEMNRDIYCMELSALPQRAEPLRRRAFQPLPPPDYDLMILKLKECC